MSHSEAYIERDGGDAVSSTWLDKGQQIDIDKHMTILHFVH